MRKVSWKDIDLKIALPRNVKSTECIGELEEFIGQERAIKALETGLHIDAKGYNVFVSGTTNTGRRTFVSRYLKKKVEGTKTLETGYTSMISTTQGLLTQYPLKRERGRYFRRK